MEYCHKITSNQTKVGLGFFIEPSVRLSIIVKKIRKALRYETTYLLVNFIFHIFPQEKRIREYLTGFF